MKKLVEIIFCVLLLGYIKSQEHCTPGFSGDQCEFSICTQNFKFSSWDNSDLPVISTSWVQLFEKEISKEDIWWNPTVFVIRVDSKNLKNTAQDAITYCRLLVDGVSLTQSSVVHRQGDPLQTLTLIGATTVSNDMGHWITVECKASNGVTEPFYDSTQGLHSQLLSVMMFPETNAKYLMLDNIPTPSESNEFTTHPLGLTFDFSVSKSPTLYVMSAISPIKQLNNAEPKNSQYRISINDIAVSHMNTGYDHRDSKRRAVVFGGIKTVSPGSVNVSVEYQTANGFHENWGDGHRSLIAFTVPKDHVHEATNFMSIQIPSGSNLKDVPEMHVNEFLTPQGYIFVTAEFSRIQNSGPEQVLYLQIVMDDVPIAEMSTKFLSGEQTHVYKTISFSAFSQVGPGSHIVKIMAKSSQEQGSFDCDIDPEEIGVQFRRLNVLIFPTEDGSNTCCGPKYHENDCNIPICFGIPSHNNSVCSGHGTCWAPDSCTCSEGFAGLKCEYPTCFNIPANNPNVCSGHGVCISRDNCSCTENYVGNNCETDCTVKPPYVEFNSAGTRIEVTFEDEMMIAGGGAESIECSFMFEEHQRFGTHATCYFRNPSKSIEINLGEDHSLVAEQSELKFKDNVLKLQKQNVDCDSYLKGSFVIRKPPGRITPEAILISSDDSISKCHNLTLDATPSLGYGNLIFKWREISNLSVPLQQYLNGLHKDKFEITDTILPVSGKYTIEVEIIDNIGLSSKAQMSFTKPKNEFTPILHLRGPSEITTYAHQDHTIHVNARYPSCIDLSDKRLLYSWSVTPPEVQLDRPNSPTLYIAPYSLQPGKTYQFTLKVGLWNSSSELGFDKIDVLVIVEESNLVAFIQGGNHRAVSSFSTLRIDASESYDPNRGDGTNQQFWSWTCCKMNGDDCDICDQKFNDLRQVPVLEIFGSRTDPLPKGTFRFGLTFSADGSEAHDSVKITIVDDLIPNVQIKKPARMHNPNRPLILRGIIDNPHQVSYKWIVVKGNLTLDDNTAPYGTESRELYIRENMLIESKYSFRLFVTKGGLTGFAEVEIDVAQAPSGGILTVNPTSGEFQSVRDKVILATTGWTAHPEQLPLHYTFYLIQGNVRVPLNVIPTTENILPPITLPFVNKQTTMKFVVSASSRDGATAEAESDEIQVLPFVIESGRTVVEVAEELFNETYTTLREEQNFEEIDRIISIAARIVASNLQNQTEETLQKSKQFKRNLLSLYAELYKDSVTFISGDLRVKVTSTIANLADIELDHYAVQQVLDILTNVYKISATSEIKKLPYESAAEAVDIISKAVDNTTESDPIYETLKNIGRLSMIDQVSGQRIRLASDNIQYSQSRQLVENLYGKETFMNDTQSAAVTIHNGTFDHVDNAQTLTSVDVRLIQWKKNPLMLRRASTGISSDILSVELVDDEGKDFKISKVGQDPIIIRIYSEKITDTSVCKYFDEVEQMWKNVTVVERKPGQYITCATTHLSDFAAFEADEEPPGEKPDEERNKDLLWLLLLLLVAPIGAVIIVGAVILVRKMKKIRQEKSKRKQMSEMSFKELESISETL